jgi:hypothetical protein
VLAKLNWDFPETLVSNLKVSDSHEKQNYFNLHVNWSGQLPLGGITPQLARINLQICSGHFTKPYN